MFRRFLPKALRSKTPLVPVLRLTGVIGGGDRPVFARP
jgi:hypothetical protein